jgi:GT2 family glycosyltransferase
VVVVDNASRDGSVEACRAAHPWAEFHVLPENVGFARANNLGVAMVADCEWVALLNPDAFAQLTWVEALHRGIERFPTAHSFASSMLLAADPRVVDGAGDAYRVDGLAWPRSQGGDASHLPTEPMEVFSPSGGAACYRRATYVAAGGLCERFFCYYEDVDLGFRLRSLGYGCTWLPDAVVHHVGSALTGKGSDFSVYHAHRNFVWTYVRNMPGRLFWVYLPAHAAANLASIAVFIRKGQGSTILRAKRDAVLGLWTTWRERRTLQAARRVAPDELRAAMQRGNLLVWAYRRALSAVGMGRR